MRGALLALMLMSSATALAQQQAVIKLEDTIRGDQEQPKVLTIVPWQIPSVKASLPSPILQRINKQFVPLERDEFVRQLDALTRQQPLIPKVIANADRRQVSETP